MLVYENKQHTNDESSIIRDLMGGDFMGTFRYDLANLDQIKILMAENVQDVLDRAKQHTAETGIVFENQAGQFMLLNTQSREDLENVIRSIVGDAQFRVASDKYGLMKCVPTLSA